MFSSRVLAYLKNIFVTRGGPTYTFYPLTTSLTSTSWDGDAYSTTAKTKIDLSAVFGVPAGVKAVLCEIWVADSASAGVTTFQGIVMGPTNVAAAGVQCHCNAVANDSKVRHQRIVTCDSNGDVYYQTVASGASTLDISIEIWAYWL